MLICGELCDGRATLRIWKGIDMEQLFGDERKGVLLQWMAWFDLRSGRSQRSVCGAWTMEIGSITCQFGRVIRVIWAFLLSISLFYVC
jgi:hypothetical protein